MDRARVPWAAAVRREEERAGRAGAERGVIGPQTPDQRRGGRDQAVLAELAVADGQDSPVQVDIRDPQLEHFADPETAAVEEAEDLRHDEVPKRGPCGRGEPIRRLKDASDFRVGQNAGRKPPVALGRQRPFGHVCGLPLAAQELRELTDHTHAVLLRASALVRSPGQPLPRGGTGQRLVLRCLGSQEPVETAQQIGAGTVSVADGPPLLDELLHERAQRTVEDRLRVATRHRPSPRYRARRRAALPCRPSRRSWSMPSWRARGCRR